MMTQKPAMARPGGASAGDFFGRVELARVVLEHHRDAVLYRVGQPIGLAHELARFLAIDERALAQRADEDFEQSWINGGAHQASPGASYRKRDREPRSPGTPSAAVSRSACILPRPSRSSRSATRRRTRGPRGRRGGGRETGAAGPSGRDASDGEKTG